MSYLIILLSNRQKCASIAKFYFLSNEISIYFVRLISRLKKKVQRTEYCAFFSFRLENTNFSLNKENILSNVCPTDI